MLRQNLPVILAESNNRNIMHPLSLFAGECVERRFDFQCMKVTWFTNNLKNLTLSLKKRTDQKNYVYQVEYILFSFS